MRRRVNRRALPSGNWVANEGEMAPIQVMSRIPIQEVVDNDHDGFIIAKIMASSCAATMLLQVDRTNAGRHRLGLLRLSSRVGKQADQCKRLPATVCWKPWRRWTWKCAMRWSPSLMDNIKWRINQEYTHNDLQAILYSVGRRISIALRMERKWKTK